MNKNIKMDGKMEGGNNDKKRKTKRQENIPTYRREIYQLII